MDNGYVRPNLQRLATERGYTAYQVAKISQLPYKTVNGYILHPEKVQEMSCRVLYGILTGIGFSVDEIGNLRLSDVFDIVSKE